MATEPQLCYTLRQMLKISTSSRYHPLHSRRRVIKVPLGAQRFLAAFEGFEGGFAIAASIVVALSFTGLSRQALLTTALISLIVNGFNSASVKYSSEHYLDELDGREKKSAFKHYFVPAFIEFICYFAISFLSIVPLIMVYPTVLAVAVCVGLTLLLLFFAGFWRGFILRTHSWSDAIETTLLGAGIILVGLVSGWIVHVLM